MGTPFPLASDRATRRRVRRREISLRVLGLTTMLALAPVSMACKRESKLAGLSDAQIMAEIERCDRIRDKSRLKQVICDNHRRECERRELCSEG